MEETTTENKTEVRSRGYGKVAYDTERNTATWRRFGINEEYYHNACITGPGKEAKTEYGGTLSAHN